MLHSLQEGGGFIASASQDNNVAIGALLT